MKANALVTVQQGGYGRTIVRDLRSQAPMTLVPRRAIVPPADGAAVVHLVGSAASPLGGDHVELHVRVGPGSHLRLHGTAATVALPGQHNGCSRTKIRVEVGAGGTFEYLPEATIVAARAEHIAELHVDLESGARARCRETIVLGRHGERPGTLATTTSVVREGTPLLRQRLDIGEHEPLSSAAYLAGARVLATETVVWDHDPDQPSSGQWWSLVPLAVGGALATVVAADAVTAQRRLREALGDHPDSKSLNLPQW